MKCLRRHFFVLLFCVLFSVGSLGIVSAESVEVPNYDIVVNSYWVTVNGSELSEDSFSFTPNNDTVETKSNSLVSSSFAGTILRYKWVFSSKSGKPLITKGGKVDLSLNKTAYSMLYTFYNSSGSKLGTVYDREIENGRLLITYVDGSAEYIDGVRQTKSSTYISNFEVSFTPTKDILKLEFILDNELVNPSYSFSKAEITYYLGEFSSTDNGWDLVVDQESKESGLLSGILGWIQNIFNKINDTFEAIGDGFFGVITRLSEGFSNIGTWFAELPSKLWSIMENGIKSLFVPSQDDIVEFKTKIDNLLEQKLGAIYQVVNLLTESWEDISDYDNQNSITFPKTTINLFEGNQFSFGGYNVLIVPSGFDSIVNILKTIIGIVCTLMFINGLRKRYDEVMGVEK